jgi:hypothetical protein
VYIARAAPRDTFGQRIEQRQLCAAPDEADFSALCFRRCLNEGFRVS